MSDDDDTGHPHKKLRAILAKPVAMKVWHVVAIAAVMFVAGAWLL